jgi:carbon storage regulator CsrA
MQDEFFAIGTRPAFRPCQDQGKAGHRLTPERFMLVLSRKAREQIQIGDEVVVTILQVKGQSVRIGIEAPRNVRVLRSELPLYETTDGNATVEKTRSSATSKSRTTSGASRSNRAGESSQATQKPPLAGRLDARRSPELKSLETLNPSQRMELTMLRFDSAVRSTSFSG